MARNCVPKHQAKPAAANIHNAKRPNFVRTKPPKGSTRAGSAFVWWSPRARQKAGRYS